MPEDLLIKCQFSYIEQGDPVSLEQFSSDLTETEEGGYQLYIDNCFAGLLQVIVSSGLCPAENRNSAKIL